MTSSVWQQVFAVGGGEPLLVCLCVPCVSCRNCGGKYSTVQYEYPLERALGRSRALYSMMSCGGPRRAPLHPASTAAAAAPRPPFPSLPLPPLLVMAPVRHPPAAPRRAARPSTPLANPLQDSIPAVRAFQPGHLDHRNNFQVAQWHWAT